MNIGGGEAADQMVRMMLTGTEVTVRLGASALKIYWPSRWLWQSITRPYPGRSTWENAPGDTGYPNVPHVAGTVSGIQAEGSQTEDSIFCHPGFGWSRQGGRCGHARHRAGARQSHF